MKVYVYLNGFMMAGKAWEIKRKLKEYGKEYVLVKDLADASLRAFPIHNSCSHPFVFVRIEER